MVVHDEVKEGLILPDLLVRVFLSESWYYLFLVRLILDLRLG
jgi:hypothetical protein